MTYAPSIAIRAASALVAALIASHGVAAAQEEPSASSAIDCSPADPDSVQISWEAPCDGDSWLFEPNVGCRMWDWHPGLSDHATWTGRCRSGVKAGWGTVQWFEHGQAIDRFEGTFVDGKRQGAGRYTWNSSNWYVGFYEDDLPNGLGTASIAGQTFSGQWQHGCFARGAQVVAIGTPRKFCDAQRGRIAAHETMKFSGSHLASQ
jgi:hypothetical protein